jgi:hypothetical protein
MDPAGVSAAGSEATGGAGRLRALKKMSGHGMRTRGSRSGKLACDHSQPKFHAGNSAHRSPTLMTRRRENKLRFVAHT